MNFKQTNSREVTDAGTFYFTPCPATDKEWDEMVDGYQEKLRKIKALDSDVSLDDDSTLVAIEDILMAPLQIEQH